MGCRVQEDTKVFALVQFTKDYEPLVLNSHSTFFEALDAM
jgi:hypothetical protein